MVLQFIASHKQDGPQGFAKNLKGIQSALVALQERDNVYMPVELVWNVKSLLLYIRKFE